MVTVAIATFSLTDMILHNRRKRSAFYAEQHAIYAQRLMEAIESEKAGLPLDDDQTLVLNRERARVQAEMAAKERSWRKTFKAALLGGLKTDDEEEQEAGKRAEAVAVPSEGEILQKIGMDQTAILERASQADKESGLQTTASSNGSGEEGTGNGSRILQAVAEKRREGERVTEAAGVVRGGPLDQMAAEAVQAVGGKIHAAEDKGGSSSSGWTRWWSRK